MAVVHHVEDLKAVLACWDHTRLDLAQFPSMTLPQILRFFSVHLHHHTYQLERIRQASTHR